MSGHSPSRRIRTKTSELTDFFRGTAPSSAQKEPSSVNLEVPSSDTDVSSKKRVKIQLFGRSRKKSNQSTASSPFSSSRDSSEFGPGEPSIRTTSSDRRPPTATREPPPPLPTAKPISIGSKLAATFGHSRLPKPSNIYTQTESALVARPSTLSPSTSRAASYESGSSNGSRTRSTTPRPSQPLITVSLSPDNVSEYKNLFTRPQPDSDLPPTPSSPTPNSRLPKCEVPFYPRRGQTPASAIAAAHRQATDDRSPSRYSSRKNSDSDKDTPGASGAQEAPRPVTRDGGEKALPPSLQRRPSTATGSVQGLENVNLRSRMKSPSTHVRSRPPSIPLPQTPVPNTPPPEIPLSPLRGSFAAELEATGAQKAVARPRAHTIGSVVSSSLPAAQITSKTTATLGLVPEANFDIETASAPQLRAALKTRNRQYDDLATYMVKVTEASTAKITTLENKVMSLDQEVAKKDKEVTRKDKELKGLRWIINNGDSSQPQPLPAGVLNHALLSPTSTPSESDQDRVPGGSSRRLYYQSDSGTESHAESMSIRSAASGSESVSSIRHKTLRKPSALAEVTYNFYRNASSTTRRPSKMPPGLGGADKTIPELPTNNTNNRSSLNSVVSPSPSSSTSSLLPPSPSITMSSLSAIPEGPPPSSALRPGLRYDNSDQEERRALRASHRVSTSSMTSSSTAASGSAYSGGNIKRSRPPSIAQVLEKSPIMDDMLDKLRPFA